MAVNLYKIRQAKDAGGELFRRAQRKRDQYQGIWILSPEGEVLSGHHDIGSHETWPQEVLQAIDLSLKAFPTTASRQVKATDPMPHRGVGVRPDGSVSLAIYTRYMLGAGRSLAPAGTPSVRLWLWDGKLRPDGPPVIDTLTLSAREWVALSPRELRVGKNWQVPEGLAGKFYRLLSATSDQGHLRGIRLTKQRLQGTVVRTDGSEAVVRFTGEWAADYRNEGRPLSMQTSATGTAIYDVQGKKLKSLLIVCHGTSGSGSELRPTGAVVEWRDSRPK